jgi:hypothetical protein
MDEDPPAVSRDPTPEPKEIDPVERQRKRALTDYETNPIRIATDANGESRERRDYAERPLLELLQNAEDALADANRLGAVLLDLSNHRLLVANHGAAFTPRGFEALCTLHNSPKPADRRRRFIGSKGTGFKAVLNWSNAPEIFSGPVHARFNRAEAAEMIDEAIGEKGRSALEANQNKSWAEIPKPLLQVPLSAEPDAEIRGLLDDGWVTVIRLPISPGLLDKVEQALNDLDPEQLLFLNQLNRLIVARNGARSDWRLDRSRRREPTGLSCEEVEITQDGRPFAVWHLMRQELPDVAISDDTDLTGAAETGRAEVGLAVQLDGPLRDDRPALVCNFFPTRIVSPLPHIALHGTFLLKGDRNHLTTDRPDHQHSLIHALCELLRGPFLEPLLQRQGAGALQYLMPQTKAVAADNEVEQALHDALIEAVKAHPFVPVIGGSKEAPMNLRTWTHGLGRLLLSSQTPAGETSLPMPEWCEEDAVEVLKALGAKGLEPEDQLEFLSDWTPSNDTDALDALELAAAALKALEFAEQHRWLDGSETLANRGDSIRNRIRNLPAWKVQNGGYRTLRAAPPFFEAKGAVVALPLVIPVEYFCEQFQQSFEKRESGRNSSLKNLRREHIRKATQTNLIEYAVLPAIQHQGESWWQEHGFEVFDALLTINPPPEDVDDDVFSDPIRQQLAQTVRLPVRGGGWKAAIDVWAGADYGSPVGETLEHDSPDQAAILESTDVHPGLSDRKPLLRYLGVSWTPKWRRHKSQERDSFRCPIEKLADRPPGLSRFPAWRSYFEEKLLPRLQEDDQRCTQDIGRWIIAETWGVEGVEVFCRSAGDAAGRLKHLERLWNRFRYRRRVEVGRQGPKYGNRESFISTDEDGFLHWQISHAAAFDVEPSPLWEHPRARLADLLLSEQKPDNWERWLPRLVLQHRPGDVAGAELHQFAQHFGAKTKLDDFADEHWRRWLDALADREWPTGERSERDLSEFLRDLARAHADVDLKPWAEEVRLPCLTEGGRVSFRRLDNMIGIDDVRHDPLRKTLIDAGQAVLLGASATHTAKLLGRFDSRDRGTGKLIQAEVASQPIDSHALHDTLARARPLVLALIEHLHKHAANKLKNVWPSAVQVHGPLSLNLFLNGKPLGSHRQDFHWDDGAAMLHVDAGAEDYESVALERAAAALAARCGHPGDGLALAHLLEKAAASQDTAREILYRHGLSQRDIDDWMPEQSSAPNDVQEPPMPEVKPEEPVKPPEPEDRPVDPEPDESPIVRPTPAEIPRQVEVEPPQSEPTPDVPPVTPPKLTPVQPLRLTPNPPPPTPKPSPATRPQPTRRRDQKRRESGQQGETWLREKLEEVLGDGYTVSDGPDTSGGGESDIVICRGTRPVLHIEVKTMEKQVFWSEGEIEKARSCAKDDVPYVMAVLMPNQEFGNDAEEASLSDDYDVRWVLNPLIRLQRLWDEKAVYVRWYWKEQSESLGNLPRIEPWTPPPREEQPTLPPCRTSFVFQPAEEDYDGQGLDHVRTYLPPGRN